MPRKPQGENARTAYIAEKFVAEAQRRKLDGNALLQKPKKNAKRKLVENYLSRQFAALDPDEKRRYQYIAEKKWPLWFERCNAEVELDHFFPGPERVVEFEFDHFQKDKRYDPGRNRFLAKERALDSQTKQRVEDFRQKIRRSRGLCQPSAPGPIEIPDNGSGGLGNLNMAGATDIAKQEEPSRLGPAPGTWKYHRHIYRRRVNQGNYLRIQVIMYRLTDDADRTLSTMVLKKEQGVSNIACNPGKQGPSNEEGQIHTQLYAACPRYVVTLFNQSFEKEDDILNPANLHPKQRKPVQKTFKRLLTEWIPHGTLFDFISTYLTSGHLIPEPFIWYCFKVLVEVALVCWNGHAGRGVKEGWEHIVNTDIKPDNVWLCAPDPLEPMAWARRYPKPKVGDFGMSYKTHHGLDDRNHARRHRRRANPPDFRGFGTTGHMPPELLHRNAAKLTKNYRHNPTRAQHTVDRLDALLPSTPLPWPNPWPADIPAPDTSGAHSWTMVWQIGTTVWCLLATMPVGGIGGIGVGNNGAGLLFPHDVAVDFSGPERDRPARGGGGDGGVESGGGHLLHALRPAYSGRLVELAFRCLAPMPAGRVGLEELWEEVCAGCEDVGGQFPDAAGDGRPPGADGIGGPGGDEGEEEDGVRLLPNAVGFVPDKYPLGRNVLNDVSPY
ncbi:serine threonine protein kinase [Diplodia corticola]|uniref:Serine threonine protein kinase n=1 Tax=Diplodia corticola TaxID=236234 RepID=A0A1J9S4Y2_9PEZI|nr:serine threonine protein kinase [Diplodia corticola]OJD35583.1 serine threonine protein kinase [Diplodia corticola]